MYLVYFILNMAGHLRVLPPLSQVYHYSKMDKECSHVTFKHCTSVRVTCTVQLPRFEQIWHFKCS
jgi:hypothetical protein